MKGDGARVRYVEMLMHLEYVCFAVQAAEKRPVQWGQHLARDIDNRTVHASDFPDTRSIRNVTPGLVGRFWIRLDRRHGLFYSFRGDHASLSGANAARKSGAEHDLFKELCYDPTATGLCGLIADRGCESDRSRALAGHCGSEARPY